MSLKELMYTGGVCFAVGLAVGRFSLPAKVVTRTVVTEAKTDDSARTKLMSDHSTITKTEVRKPDGTTVTTEVTKKNLDASDLTVDKTTDATRSDTEKTVTRDVGRWEVSALAVTNLRGLGSVSYGAYVGYRLLGPIQVGALGASDGLAGISLGLRF